MPILDGRLAAAAYLAGPYSVADIALGCTLLETEGRGLPLAPYPQLTAWRGRLRPRPAWQE